MVEYCTDWDKLVDTSTSQIFGPSFVSKINL